VTADTFGHLDDDSATFQLDFFPLIEVIIAPPMAITNIVSTFVIYHNASIEAVKLEAAILPPLLLPAEVVGEETEKL
jgi:hypothetical protein